MNARKYQDEVEGPNLSRKVRFRSVTAAGVPAVTDECGSLEGTEGE